MGNNARLETAAGAAFVAAAMLGTLQPANAYLPNECMLGFAVAVCAPMAVNPDARIINLNEAAMDDSPEANARRREWRERCQPRIVRDMTTGMRRYVYAVKGCEFGP